MAVKRKLNILDLIFWMNFNSTKNFTFEISEMVAFAKEVDEWMSQDDKNIVVIHCKGGKGKNLFLFLNKYLYIKVQEEGTYCY